jgi:transcriptional regulator with XRE-family HTH domain
LPTWKFKTHANVADKQTLPVYSRRLREARQALDLSQRALGIEAGLDEFVASTRVNRYETGIHQPDLQTLQRLAAVLERPVAFFYAEDDELAQLIADFKGRSKSKR